MAKDISIKLNFDSNGQTVMGNLSISAKQLNTAVASLKKNTESSFKSLMTTVSAVTVSINGIMAGLQSFAEPVKSFDTAMRAANTMAGKDIIKKVNKRWGVNAGIGLNADICGKVRPGLFVGISYQLYQF